MRYNLTFRKYPSHSPNTAQMIFLDHTGCFQQFFAFVFIAELACSARGQSRMPALCMCLTFLFLSTRISYHSVVDCEDDHDDCEDGKVLRHLAGVAGRHKVVHEDAWVQIQQGRFDG